MSIISEPKTCSKCGGPIPAEAPEGLCPKCLLLGVSLPTEGGKGAQPKGPPPTREEVAAAFPHLEILEFIGQGGMGFVFKARQPKLDRFVALKILPQSLAADPAFAERFIREGRLLARLTHPAIVAVHDFGQANGFFYLLMEYVDGVNLRQAMKVGRFTPAQALAIVPGICDALQFAHNAGILHRDIKPENILLDAKGRVKIADFGIAKLMGEPGAGGTLTDRGSALGTPHYMAPEQLEHPQDVDQRADIYSLGVVFYEMLTGELPIGRFAPPSEKSTVDPRMDEVVLRTLEKERERRTQTAGEVKTQVETIAAAPAPAGSRRGETPAESPKPRQDWWTWSPLQSPEVGEICAHLTKAERNHLSLLGLLFGVWIPGTCFGIPALIKLFPSPGNWIVASVWLVLFAVSIPMIQRLVRHFLCSTNWAKERGFTPDQLRLFSYRRANLWKAAAVLIAGLVLILAQHKAITRYLGLSAQTKPDPAPEHQQDGAATSRAALTPAAEPDLAANIGPFTKTFILTRATNTWVGDSQEVQNVEVWTETAVDPGEVLMALVKRADSSGSLEEARCLQFVNWQPDSVKTSTSLSWFFGSRYTPGFGESEAEAAATQLRENVSDKPLTLTAGEPLEVFAVTNRSGGFVAGYVKYMRAVPTPSERSGRSVVKPQAIVHVRRYAAYSPSITYSVTLPPGYALWATASLGQASTHFSPASKAGEYYTAWFRQQAMAPGDYRDYPARRQAEQKALEEQFQALLDQGPIPVVLGKPTQVFALTNKNGGEVYRGFWELVAPTPAGATPKAPPKHPAHTKLAPSLRQTLQASKHVSRTFVPCSPATGLPPRSAATAGPRLDPATGLPVPVGTTRVLPASIDPFGNPLPPRATSPYPRLGPDGMPLPPGATSTLTPKIGPDGMPLPQGAISTPAPKIGPDGMPLPPGVTSTLTPKLGPDGMPLPPGVTSSGRRSTARDPWELLAEARELTAKGDYETALQRYLSYHERTRTSPTRPPLVSALGDWVELGGKYPKAREALAEIQKRDVREFSQDQGSVELFHELVQINDALQEEAVTYALFKALEQADLPLAKQCYAYAEEVLVRRGEYELCLSCLGDVQRRYEIGLGTYKMGQGLMSRTRSQADTSAFLKKSSDDRFVGQVCRWVEILVGTGGKAEAEKLRDQALADLGDPRLKSAVSDAEERVRKVQASPRPALAQSTLRVPAIPGPTPVNPNFTEPSASVEHWQPSLAPGQKPNLEGIRGEAKDLAAGGQYEEALQRYLWYHNHALEYDPNQRGVRLSFVLSDWVVLGRKYPKAKQALLEIRDGNTRKLVEGRGSSQLFRDVAAINREYASEDATYALFKTVQERDPALAQQCYRTVEDLLVRKGEYALCLTCLGDYQARFASLRQEWEAGKSREDNMSRKFQESGKKMAEYRAQQGQSPPIMPQYAPPKYHDKHFVEETRRLIEILVGTGHKAEAGKIQEQAVAALDDARLKSAIADAEKRMRN